MRMGNTPTHHPVPDDDSTADDSSSRSTLRGTVFGPVRGLVTSVRRHLSVFPSLTLGRAFGRSGRDIDATATEEVTQSDHTDTPILGAPASSPLPPRDRPLTEPDRNRDPDNGPELEASESNGQLSIYYPDRQGATLTSDTWQNVER
jgi:hypothetical protein